jgi:hypothetical protein
MRRQDWETGSRRYRPNQNRPEQRWVRELGFGGHFSTKSRRYSTTLGVLRRARAVFAARRHRSRHAELSSQIRHESAGAKAVVILACWRYVGSGYLTEGEAWLARSAAADAREQRRVARLELAMA